MEGPCGALIAAAEAGSPEAGQIPISDKSHNPVLCRTLTGLPARRLRYSVFAVHPDQTPAAILFYDGHCGLCHRAVRFVLHRDRSGTAFRFAPLQGATFQALVPARSRTAVPDSIAVVAADGALLVRSDACVYVLRRLPGAWKAAAALLAAIPRPLRDALYNLVARSRYRIFGRREDLCPVAAPDESARFDP